MREGNFKLIDKRPISESGLLWRLSFEAPDIEAEPGQFVNIGINSHYLRRPISVSEYDDGVLTLIVQVVGDGTLRLVATPVGQKVNMLTGLGNRFYVPDALEKGIVLLLGGGVGYAPLVGWLKKLYKETDLCPVTVFGFNSAADVPLDHIAELREEGFPIEYSTMTGEMGDCGNALEVMQEYIEIDNLNPVYFYTCGPMPMMKAVGEAFDFDGQLSLEARMGCGFGACMGCSIQTADGPRRICKEGPVFSKSQLKIKN